MNINMKKVAILVVVILLPIFAISVYKWITATHAPFSLPAERAMHLKNKEDILAERTQNCVQIVKDDIRATGKDEKSSDRLAKDVVATAQQEHLDPLLFAALLHQESRYSQTVVSDAGAVGIGQLTPVCTKELEEKYGLVVDAYDEMSNLQGSAKFLHALLDEFSGNEKLALAAYNAGAPTVWKNIDVPEYGETIHYVRNIQEHRDALKERF